MNNLYIFYSKKDFNLISNLINLLKEEFQKSEIELLIDFEQVSFKDNFGNFYQKIGNSKFVIMLITDNFLKDSICMDICYQLTNYEDFTSSVFPIVFPDAKIYDMLESIDYLEFWENRKNNLEQKIRTLNSLENINSIMSDINKMSNIRKVIAQFISDVSNMYAVTIDDLQKNNFEDLIIAISSKIIH